jgi:hypothetical protein
VPRKAVIVREILQARQHGVQLLSERSQKGEPVSVRFEGGKLVLIYENETDSGILTKTRTLKK